MKTIRILEDHDMVRADDWCRPLYITFDGQTDAIILKSHYCETPVNNLRWIKVREIYGSTYYNQRVCDLNANTSPMEFVRGVIPLSHQYQSKQSS